MDIEKYKLRLLWWLRDKWIAPKGVLGPRRSKQQNIDFRKQWDERYQKGSQ